MHSINDPVGPNEAEIIEAMVSAAIERQKKRHKPGTVARRFLHGKSLGVANAIFSVKEVDESLRIGLFAQPAEYRAVVRFSNGILGADAWDIVPNVRGMAVKLYDVPGRKLLPGEENSRELDLILANDRTFFVSKIEHMLMLTQGKFVAMLFQSPATFLRSMMASNKFVSGVLNVDYYSQVPYRFGDRACKFSLTHDVKDIGFPNIFDKDYMRHGMEKQLRKEAHSFTFSVQLQQENESISDSTKPWRGEFIPLGQLTILQTNKAIAEQDGESLSFNPFRTLPEHEALAWAGRLRKAIYDADFKWRAKVNEGEQLARV